MGTRARDKEVRASIDSRFLSLSLSLSLFVIRVFLRQMHKAIMLGGKVSANDEHAGILRSRRMEIRRKFNLF